MTIKSHEKSREQLQAFAEIFISGINRREGTGKVLTQDEIKERLEIFIGGPIPEEPPNPFENAQEEPRQ